MKRSTSVWVGSVLGGGAGFRIGWNAQWFVAGPGGTAASSSPTDSIHPTAKTPRIGRNRLRTPIARTRLEWEGEMLLGLINDLLGGNPVFIKSDHGVRRANFGSPDRFAGDGC